MPERRSSDEKPPKAMTWAKAAPILAVAAVFYLARVMCEQMWFFGPALAAAYCSGEVGGVLSTWTAGLLGTKTAAVACGAGAAVVGYVSAPAIAVFGIVMAMAVGFFGWLTVGFLLLMTNARIFKENAGNTLWFVSGLLISELPVIGILPGTLGATYVLYRAQIKRDKKKLQAYEAELDSGTRVTNGSARRRTISAAGREIPEEVRGAA